MTFAAGPVLWLLAPAGGELSGETPPPEVVAAEEIERIARAYDGTATPEARALLERLRGVLAGLVARAAGGGERSREAWELLERTMAGEEGTVAMEAVLAVLEEKGHGLEHVARSLPAMAAGVRRHVVERLEAGSFDLGPVEGLLFRALTGEPDREARTGLVRLLAGRGGLEGARALLAAAPPAPAARRHEPRGLGAGEWRFRGDRDSPLREALADALSRYRAEAVRRWLESEAFATAQPGELWMLCRVAERLRLEGARRRLEDLLESPVPGLGLRVLSVLEVLGPGPSREWLEAVAAGPQARPEVAARAAVLLARATGDPEGGRERAVALLGKLAERRDWRARREAVAALGGFPEDGRAFSVVLEHLRGDPNREVRRAAYGALTRFRRREAIEAVLALLEPLQGRDRRWAVEYLQRASRRRHGADPAAWRSWWESVKTTFEFPRDDECPGEEPDAPARRERRR